MGGQSFRRFWVFAFVTRRRQPDCNSGGRGSRRADCKTNAHYCPVRQEPHPPSAGSKSRQWPLGGSCFERLFAADDFVSGVSGGRGSRRADYKTNAHYCPVRQGPHPPSAGSKSRQWPLEGSCFERLFAADDFVSGVSGGRGSRRADYKTSAHYCTVRQEPHPPSAGSRSRQWPLGGSSFERLFAADDFVSGVSGGRGSRRADYKNKRTLLHGSAGASPSQRRFRKSPMVAGLPRVHSERRCDATKLRRHDWCSDLACEEPQCEHERQHPKERQPD